MTPHKLSKWCGSRCSCIIIRLQFNNCRNHSIQMPSTSYLLHVSSRLRPPIPVVPIHQASSASAETSPSAIVPWWRFCPSPSRVCHLRSACPAVSLLHPHLSHPPQCRNLQDRSDCLWLPSSSPPTSVQALWLSIPHFQLSLCLPAPAWSLPLHLQHGFLPQRFISPHDPRSIALSRHSLWCAFLVFSPPQASVWIASCAMPQWLELVLLPSHSCLHSLDDIIMWTSLSICRIYPPEMVRRSSSEHWPL